MQIIWQKTSSDFFSQKFSPPLQLSHKPLNKSFWVFVANVCWFSIQRIPYADRNWHMHIFKNERFCWFFSLIFVTKRFKIKKEGVRVNLCFWFFSRLRNNFSDFTRPNFNSLIKASFSENFCSFFCFFVFLFEIRVIFETNTVSPFRVARRTTMKKATMILE